MNIIELYENLKGSYKSYLESFVAIKDERIKENERGTAFRASSNSHGFIIQSAEPSSKPSLTPSSPTSTVSTPKISVTS